MITEFFLTIVFNIASSFLSVLPEFSWDVSTSGFEYVRSILAVVGYIVPMGPVFAILTLMCSLLAIRFAISIGRTIWDLLPLV